MNKYIIIILGSFIFKSDLSAQGYINIDQPIIVQAEDSLYENAGAITIGGQSPLLIPRMDSARIYDIEDPAEGLLVLDTSTYCFMIFYESNWHKDCFYDAPLPIRQADPRERSFLVERPDGSTYWHSPDQYRNDFHRSLFSAASSTTQVLAQAAILSFTDFLDPRNSFEDGVFTIPETGTYFITTHVTFDRGGQSTSPSNELLFAITRQAGSSAELLTSIIISPEEFTSSGREITSSLTLNQRLLQGQEISVRVFGIGAGSQLQVRHRAYSGFILTKG